jgi:O-methyltransferase
MESLYLDLLKKCLTGAIYPQSSNLEIYPTSGDKSRSLIKRVVLQYLNSKGYKLVKVIPFNREARENGLDWPSICYSMIGLKRMSNFQSCIETVIRDGVVGDIIETGVWRGGACILAQAILKVYGIGDRTLWLADSFQGLPTPSLDVDRGYDLAGHPYMSVSIEDVQGNFRRFDLLDERVKFLKGWFKDTLPSSPIERLAVLRLDGDLYESTMDVLTSLYDRVSINGFVIVDDYHTWPNCRHAIDEFRSLREIRDRIEEIDGSGIFWRKLA